MEWRSAIVLYCTIIELQCSCTEPLSGSPDSELESLSPTTSKLQRHHVPTRSATASQRGSELATMVDEVDR